MINLKLQQKNAGWINISIISMVVTQVSQSQDIVECLISSEIELVQFQVIEKNELFNLFSSIKRPLINEFKDCYPIKLELLLKPNFLSLIPKYAQTTEEVINYLNRLNQKHTTDLESSNAISPLLQAENWLCLSVKQQQKVIEIGYETLWNDVRPLAFLEAKDSGESTEISEAITDFFSAWTESNLSHLSSTIQKTKTSKPFDGLTQLFDNFEDVALKAITKAVTEDEFLLKNIIAFLEKDNWPFEKIPEQPSLRLRYQGENWQWNCYATVDETKKTVVFYSVCPITTPEPRREVIAEFITRVNYGMVIGNFEMDYTDGEVRYKTSIDVEGTLLSQALIKQLIYTNVLMMDQYSIALEAVIKQGMNAEAAISLIEP